MRTEVPLFSVCSKPPVFFLHSAVLHARCYSHGSQESDEEFDARWVTYFNKPDIDAWELRKGMLNEKGRVTWRKRNCLVTRNNNLFSLRCWRAEIVKTWKFGVGEQSCK